MLAANRHGGRWGRLALVVGALGLLLAGCGQAFPGANTAPPSSWTDITPPDSGQAAHYAVSPDIPGLIIATIGGRTQASADPPSNARLWRSKDGGANWQSLDSLTPRSGSSVYMPPGGHGLVIEVDALDASIAVSHDEGTTWRTAPVHLASNQAGISVDNEISAAVMVGGRLYSISDGRFAVSDDGGLTWRTIAVGADPAGAGMTTLAITPLDASGSSWLRLVSESYAGSAQSAFERSDDGGATWRIVSQTVPTGNGRLLFGTQLAASAAHPGHVCAAITMLDNAAPPATLPTVTPASTAPPQPSASPGAQGFVSYPPPTDKDVALLASDDGGQTWRGGVVEALRRSFGGAVQPGVHMSADGSCYLATGQQGSPFDIGADVLATFWRLAPGATQPVAQWAMAGRLVESLALAPGGAGAAERVVALTRISGPGDGEAESCGPGCTTRRDAGAYRLIWQPLAPRG